jgi:hypothetical protein
VREKLDGIGISLQIADVPMNLALALANPTQIRNGITKLLGKTGKPWRRS